MKNIIYQTLSGIKIAMTKLEEKITNVSNKIPKKLSELDIDIKYIPYNYINTINDNIQNAKAPICIATSNDGVTYYINDSNIKPRNGEVVVIIPTTTNTSKDAYLYINGDMYCFYRLGIHDTGRTEGLDSNGFLTENRPVICLLVKDESGINDAFIVGHNIPEVRSGYVVCDSNASAMNKFAPINDHDCSVGSTAFVVFKNGNTNTKPKILIKSGGGYLPIIDRSGNTIGVDAIKANYLHQFVCDGSHWVLID